MFPKSGSGLPRPGTRPSEAEYISAIGEALRQELGGTRAATKTIMRWTGASDRTARNWMSGAAAPSGYNLICLAGKSDAVLGALLAMSDRHELALASDIHAVEVALVKAMGAIELLKRQHLRGRNSPKSVREALPGRQGP